MARYYLLEKDGTRLCDYTCNYYPSVSKREAEEYAMEKGYKEGEGEGEAYMEVSQFNKIQGY